MIFPSRTTGIRVGVPRLSVRSLFDIMMPYFHLTTHLQLLSLIVVLAVSVGAKILYAGVNEASVS